jgi:hypothetical protein
VTGWSRREPAEPDRTSGGSMRSAALTGQVPLPPLGVYCLASGLAATGAGSAVSLPPVSGIPVTGRPGTGMELA